MPPTKKLIAVLRGLATLLDDESARNPDFAARLEAVLAGLPSRTGNIPRNPKLSQSISDTPDVFAALQEKGETEFRFWVRSLDVSTLKTIIKSNGFDPARTSQRWTDPDKFATMVADQTIARMKRGSAFLTLKVDNARTQE